jgi:plasmid stabilization system protein ParE
MNFVILESAENDVIEIWDYYEQQQEGLGERFLDEFERAADGIRRFPRMYEVVFGAIRLCPTRKFPYGIFYTVGKTTIVVHAIIHLHRSRRYWKSRLR